jgi:predicted aspartyl protease
MRNLRKLCTGLFILFLVMSVYAQPVQADTTKIKFTDFLGLVIFQGEMDGYKCNLLLDTGADTSIVDTRFAKKHNMKKIVGPLGILGLGGIDQYKVGEIVIGDWYFKDLDLVGIDLSIIDRYLGISLDGIVGGDFLSKYVLSVDYQKSFFTISDEAPKVSKNASAIPFDLRGKLVFTKAKASPDSTPRTFLVDTGATSTVYFKNRLEEVAPGYKKWPRSLGWLEASFMGKKEVDLYLVPSFAVGDVEIESMVTIVSEAGLLGIGVNLISGSPTHGIVGWTFLKNFKVTFDYPRERIIFEPYEYYVEKWPHLFDSIGIMIAFEDGKPVVEHIIPNTGAASSQVKAGDKLVMIDNIDVTSKDGLEISEMVMGEPGTVVNFLFERDGKKFRVSMKRERLFKE